MAARQLHLLRCNLPDNQRRRKRRIFRHQLDPLESYTDSELRSRYRLDEKHYNTPYHIEKKKAAKIPYCHFKDVGFVV